jgi:hypothetical protein
MTSEHAIQSAFFDWAKLHPVARRAYAVPNAAKRSPRLASMMIAEGLRKGVLDVHIPVAAGGCHGMWIEFKAGRNTLTPEQAAEVDQLAHDGFFVLVSWDAVDAIQKAVEYLNGHTGPGKLVMKPVCARSRSARSTR